MKKAGIIGFGLIGGSIAIALKKRCGMDIAAFSRSEAPMKAAFDEGIVSEYSTADLNIFKDCDIIFVCTPVSKICDYIESLIPIIKPTCIITDAGSTKGEIYTRLSKYEGINFIGGHPMAGSEKTGYGAAKEDLYENAFYVLTPSKQVSKELVEEYELLVKKIGAIPVILDPYKHDHAVAAISHVPHIIAASLVNTVHRLDDDGNMHTLAAGGFKDVTRIASSGAEMWRSICMENKDEILQILDAFANNIDDFKTAIKAEDQDALTTLFTEAKTYRDSFAVGKGRGTCKMFLLKVDISDKPGAIAQVVTILSDNSINIKNIGIVNNREYNDGVMTISLESHKDVLAAADMLKTKGYSVFY